MAAESFPTAELTKCFQTSSQLLAGGGWAREGKGRLEKRFQYSLLGNILHQHYQIFSGGVVIPTLQLVERITKFPAAVLAVL